MSEQGAGRDGWLFALVAVIFIAGITIYVGWDEVGSVARQARMSLFKLF